MGEDREDAGLEEAAAGPLQQAGQRRGGTQGDDVFGAAGDAGGVNVFGLQAAVNILFPEQANDRLTLNALGGKG